ncbi:hypothetical protein OEZ85_002660 [Tetradesmus obliquus]|uniref:Fungal lipase-type domain-containing protein n=1 Tax=Tetradesmus obliquus TaxID=3088 RepID=A0ABY8U2E4_TETOB|nr:hypothetical protein OEZ85_002660 [Tetradesmus obliquus]
MLVFALVAVAGVAAQTSASSWGGFTPRPTTPAIKFECQPLPTLSGDGSQSWRLECFSGNIPVGGSAEGLFDWKAGMTSNTAIKSVQLELVDKPGSSAEGTDFLSMSGSFLASGYILPTCAAQQYFSLRDAGSATTALSWPKSWRGHAAQRHGRPITYSCSSKMRALSLTDKNNTDDVSTATWKWVPKPVIPTPGGLRLRLSCQKRSAGGGCAVFVRLLVQFANNTLAETMNVYEKTAREVEQRENWRAEIRTWVDEDGVLGTKGATVETEVCYPRAPGNGSNDSPYKPPGGGRKLLQQNQTLQMAPVLPYNRSIITKATRLARYASAIHGCQPSTPDRPQTYIAADGSRQLRQWDGPTGMSSWGGPGIGVNRQPGPECRSCFKDGISFSTDPPRGFQTPEFSLADTESFFDAAIVFTDRVISGVAGRNAVVVLFRATVTDTQASQWISNIGYCFLASGGQVPPTTNVASGTVCDGWNNPVDALNTLGLEAEVIRRLNALPESDRTVYVTGHSRGGALAAVFASKLLALQAAGDLPAYSGDANDQIKLYTFGAPRVGDTRFAAYLESNMRERYRIVNRYDGVPSAPMSGYAHFRPTIWYRDSSGDVTPSPTKGCVLINQANLTTPQRSCFISCNSVLTCSYGAGAPEFPDQPSPSWFTTRPQCTDLSDIGNAALSGATLAPGSTTLIDHASYLGLDMNNNGCRADLSFINAYTITPGTFFGFNCVARTQ